MLLETRLALLEIKLNILNIFVPNTPFLYPLKTSENYQQFNQMKLVSMLQLVVSLAYFDVKVFSPTVKVHLTESLNMNEQTKKRAYNRRVSTIDQGSFTPLVFTCFRGMSRECLTYYNRLAERIAGKRNESIEKIKSGMRCRLNFNLLRS